MKKILSLIVVLLSSAVIAQTPNWTDVKETNISIANVPQMDEGVDIFTNHYGSHIIVQEISALRYYRMDVNGYCDPNYNETFELSFVTTPSISGDDSKIFIVYATGNIIKVRRSFDGGDNWTLYSFNVGNTISSIESVVSNGKLHIAYTKSNQIYHRSNVGIIWSQEVLVSEGQDGEYPRITARYGGTNNDFIYFFWRRLGTHAGYWREYEVTGNVWGDVKFAYEAFVQNLLSSKPAGFNVTQSTIIFYFSYLVDEQESTTRRFSWWSRDLNTNDPLSSSNPEINWHQNKVYSATTSDGKSHVVYYLNEGGLGGQYDIWRSNSLHGFWDDNVYDYSEYPYWEYGPRYINNSSAGNEVHVIWKDEFGNNGGNNLRYKFDDQTPIAPRNLTITKSANNHPLLSWLYNPEPDINHYKIHRWDSYGGGWQPLAQTSNTSYEDVTLTYCTAIPPQQCPDLRTFQFKVTAVDSGSHESEPSNIVESRLVGGPPSKAGSGDPGVETLFDYSLRQNYPNPFNPTTTINYSIKSAGLVTLKVYDMLGTEVASLVDERKEAGNYTVEFNASNLPSGIYIYKLTAGSFIDTKKIILLK